tara:strand:+ start:90 stop:584 length:495 start_codon:yes stop_codon:yes gene_type:complete
MRTLQETIDYLNSLMEATHVKKELRTYQSFISLLKDLQSKKLTKMDQEKIEKQLSELKLTSDSTNKYKQIKKAKRIFTAFLQKTFAFITKDYYTGMYMSIGLSIGMSLGMGIGVAFGMPKGLVFGMMIGMTIGMCFGLLFGNMQDAIAEREGRTLKMNCKISKT